LKKGLKWALSRALVLAALHRIVFLAERAHLPEEQLGRLYRGVIGLHIFRGFRRALSRTDSRREIAVS
jgi:hypothetical protein